MPKLRRAVFAMGGVGLIVATLAILAQRPAAVRERNEAGWLLREDIVKLSDRATEASNRNDFRTARDLVAEAVRLSRERRLADVLGDSLFQQAQLLQVEGRLSEAVATYQEALQMCKSLQEVELRVSVLENLGVAQARLGKLDEAEETLEECVQALRQLQRPKASIAGPARYLGSVAAVRGDLRKARTWYDVASLELETKPDPGMIADVRALRALLLRDEGDYKRALAELRECLAFWQGRPDGPQTRWVAATLCQIASVHSAAGDQGQAEQELRRARKLYEQVGDRHGRAHCDQLLGKQGLYASSLPKRIEEFF
jgi:tetratricopeptide (TPR) repeat protein